MHFAAHVYIVHRFSRPCEAAEASVPIERKRIAPCGAVHHQAQGQSTSLAPLKVDALTKDGRGVAASSSIVTDRLGGMEVRLNYLIQHGVSVHAWRKPQSRCVILIWSGGKVSFVEGQVIGSSVKVVGGGGLLSGGAPGRPKSCTCEERQVKSKISQDSIKHLHIAATSLYTQPGREKFLHGTKMISPPDESRNQSVCM